MTPPPLERQRSAMSIIKQNKREKVRKKILEELRKDKEEDEKVEGFQKKQRANTSAWKEMRMILTDKKNEKMIVKSRFAKGSRVKRTDSQWNRVKEYFTEGNKDEFEVTIQRSDTMMTDKSPYQRNMENENPAVGNQGYQQSPLTNNVSYQPSSQGSRLLDSLRVKDDYESKETQHSSTESNDDSEDNVKNSQRLNTRTKRTDFDENDRLIRNSIAIYGDSSRLNSKRASTRTDNSWNLPRTENSWLNSANTKNHSEFSLHDDPEYNSFGQHQNVDPFLRQESNRVNVFRRPSPLVKKDSVFQNVPKADKFRSERGIIYSTQKSEREGQYQGLLMDEELTQPHEISSRPHSLDSRGSQRLSQRSFPSTSNLPKKDYRHSTRSHPLKIHNPQVTQQPFSSHPKTTLNPSQQENEREWNLPESFDDIPSLSFKVKTYLPGQKPLPHDDGENETGSGSTQASSKIQGKSETESTTKHITSNAEGKQFHQDTNNNQLQTNKLQISTNQSFRPPKRKQPALSDRQPPVFASSSSVNYSEIQSKPKSSKNSPNNSPESLTTSHYIIPHSPWDHQNISNTQTRNWTNGRSPLIHSRDQERTLTAHSPSPISERSPPKYSSEQWGHEYSDTERFSPEFARHDPSNIFRDLRMKTFSEIEVGSPELRDHPDLLRQLEEHRQRYEKLQESLNQMPIQKPRLRIHLDDLENHDHQTLQVIVKKLQHEATLSHNELTDLQRKRKVLEIRESKLSEQLNQHSGVLHSSKSKVSKLSNDIDRLRADISRLYFENDELKRQNSDLVKKNKLYANLFTKQHAVRTNEIGVQFEYGKKEPETREQARLRKFKASIDELLTTEEFYVHSLESVIKYFKIPLLKGDIIEAETVKKVFAPFDAVVDINQHFLKSIKLVFDRIQDPYEQLPNLCSVWLEQAENFKEYAKYICSFRNAVKILCNDKNPKIATFLQNKTAELAEAKFRTTSLNAYLIMPVQRLPRYKLLFAEMGKYTKNLPELTEMVQLSANKANEIAMYCNQEQRTQEDKERTKELIELLKLESVANDYSKIVKELHNVIVKFPDSGKIIEDAEVALFTNFIVIYEPQKKQKGPIPYQIVPLHPFLTTKEQLANSEGDPILEISYAKLDYQLSKVSIEFKLKKQFEVFISELDDILGRSDLTDNDDNLLAYKEGQSSQLQQDPDEYDDHRAYGGPANIYYLAMKYYESLEEEE